MDGNGVYQACAKVSKQSAWLQIDNARQFATLCGERLQDNFNAINKRRTAQPLQG
jgi:hypothetical protein